MYYIDSLTPLPTHLQLQVLHWITTQRHFIQSQQWKESKREGKRKYKLRKEWRKRFTLFIFIAFTFRFCPLGPKSYACVCVILFYVLKNNEHVSAKVQNFFCFERFFWRLLILFIFYMPATAAECKNYWKKKNEKKTWKHF